MKNSKILIPTILIASSLFLSACGNSPASTSTTPASDKCIITIDGQKYDVTQFRTIHKGGDVFNCGQDITQAFRQQHGNTKDNMLNNLPKIN